MLRFAKDFQGMGVVNLVDGRRIAVIGGLVINPHNLSVAAFICQSRKIQSTKYIVTEDVRTINDDSLIVNDEETLTDLDELLRLQEFVAINYQIIDKHVRTNHQRRVGVVIDYAVDDRTMLVEKLYVRPSLVKLLQSSDKVIGREQIVEVGDKAIVVKEATVENRAPVVKDVVADV